MQTNPFGLPKIGTLSDGSRVRVIRADPVDIVFDRLGVEPEEGDPETILAPACGVAGADFGAFDEVLVAIETPISRYLSPLEAIDQAQRTMDGWAKEWGYDHVARACTYVGDPYARFNAEGVALRNARSAVWAYLDSHQEDAATAEELAVILQSFKPERPSAPY